MILPQNRYRDPAEVAERDQARERRAATGCPACRHYQSSQARELWHWPCSLDRSPDAGKRHCNQWSAAVNFRQP